MKYFKNTELAKLYNVSEKSVRNWIQAAESGKLDLQLHQEKDRLYIANITKNVAVVELLAKNGKKYRNTRGFKRALPSAEFYDRYNSTQIFDIISNIDIYREIPYQYTYFNGGAQHWDLYTQKLLQEESSNYLTDIIELLTVNGQYIDDLLTHYAGINIIDIGVGNGLPVRKLLEHFVKHKKLNRYIGIDVSKDMLEIAERNIKKWFKDEVRFEGYVKDINYDRFEDLLLVDSFDTKNEPILNLALFFGSTLVNFREPDRVLHTVHDSMGKNDLLLFSLKLDSEKSRRYFDFTTTEIESSSDNFRGKELLDILNINESFYTLEQFFDEKSLMRKTQVRFNVAVAIEFQLEGKKRTINLNKGDALLLWRAKHQSLTDTIDQFDQAGFDLLQATRSKDQENVLLISKIKANANGHIAH